MSQGDNEGPTEGSSMCTSAPNKAFSTGVPLLKCHICRAGSKPSDRLLHAQSKLSCVQSNIGLPLNCCVGALVNYMVCWTCRVKAEARLSQGLLDMRALVHKHRDVAQLAAALKQAGLPASVGHTDPAGTGHPPGPLSSPAHYQRSLPC